MIKFPPTFYKKTELLRASAADVDLIQATALWNYYWFELCQHGQRAKVLKEHTKLTHPRTGKKLEYALQRIEEDYQQQVMDLEADVVGDFERLAAGQMVNANLHYYVEAEKHHRAATLHPPSSFAPFRAAIEAHRAAPAAPAATATSFPVAETVLNTFGPEIAGTPSAAIREGVATSEEKAPVQSATLTDGKFSTELSMAASVADEDPVAVAVGEALVRPARVNSALLEACEANRDLFTEPTQVVCPSIPLRNATLMPQHGGPAVDDVQIESTAWSTSQEISTEEITPEIELPPELIPNFDQEEIMTTEPRQTTLDEAIGEINLPANLLYNDELDSSDDDLAASRNASSKPIGPKPTNTLGRTYRFKPAAPRVEEEPPF